MNSEGKTNNKKLTGKELKFALEYLADPKMNAEKAALKAGYSATVARKKAYFWVGKSRQNKKKHIAEYIEKEMSKFEEDREDRIKEITNKIFRLMDIVPMDIYKEMNFEMKTENLKKISPDNALLIKNVIPTKNGIKLIFHDTLKIIELAGRRLGLWQIKDNEGTPVVIVDTKGIEEYL